MFDNKPSYDHGIRQAGDAKVLCIADLNNGGRSVTNAVEQVLADMVKEYGTLPAWIIYRDSDGNWDRIMASPEGKFIGFTAITRTSRPQTLKDALQLILELEAVPA